MVLVGITYYALQITVGWGQTIENGPGRLLRNNYEE
jgi:hypothetical protein